jgi:hypothetical protein
MIKFISPTLAVREVSPKEFVQFWERLYPEKDYNEAFYQENIGQPLTLELIVKWFEWKNGRNLSALKARAIRRNFSLAEQIARDADEATLTAFLSKPGGVIWRIFWLHLHHPEQFPIYDQHVERAMAFMLKWPAPNQHIPLPKAAKIRRYLNDYRPFFDSQFAGYDRRLTDRALWTFGRFLSTYGAIVASTGQN